MDTLAEPALFDAAPDAPPDTPADTRPDGWSDAFNEAVDEAKKREQLFQELPREDVLKASSLLENTVLIIVGLGHGVKKQVTESATRVETTADKTKLGVIKRLLTGCKEYGKIGQVDRSFKAQLARIAIDAPGLEFGGGSCFLCKPNDLPEARALLDQWKAERQLAIEAFLAVYTTKVAEDLAALSDMANASDYRSLAEVRANFSFKRRFIDFGPSKKLGAAYSEEYQAFVREAKDAISEARDAFRSELANYVSHVVERLTPGEDGKAKIFKRTSFDKIGEFFKTFERQNDLLQDDEILPVIAKLKSLMAGTCPQDIRDNSDLRASIAKGFSEAKGALAELIENKGTRTFLIEDDTDATEGAA